MTDAKGMDGSPSLVERWGSNKLGGVPLDGPMPGPYIRIKFQAGPIQEVGLNGCAIEDVIDVLVERLRGFQRGPFRCTESRVVLGLLVRVKDILLERTALRQSQGVEGQNLPHQPAWEERR